jgi:hypothetical protein
MLVRWLVSGVVVVAAGCASAAPGTDGGEAGDSAPDALQASVPATSAPNLLSGDELRQVDVGNVYDALRRLRPQWLRARGSASMVTPRATEPIVYVSGIRRGELRTLQNVNLDTVSRVEFIDSRDATTRFGTGHSGGVIWVELTRGN